MNTVIFGAAGFIGSYLLDELKGKVKDLIAVDIDRSIEKSFKKRRIPLLLRDITKRNALRYLPNNVDCVINLASLQPDNVSASEFDPVKYVEANTIGTLNILEYCVRNNVRKMIHVVSHRSVINGWPFQTEQANYNIDYDSEFAEFSVSEMAAIEMIHCYRAKHDIKVTILRIPAVFGYGPHLEGYQKGKHAKTGFQTFIDQAMEGEPIEIWGNPSAGRDIVYVKDVVRAIVLAMESKTADGLYNIASGKVLTLEDEVRTIIDAFSPVSNPTVIYRPELSNGIKYCSYNIEKAFVELGWRPKYSFKEMLADYKQAFLSCKFDFLIDKRKNMLKERQHARL